jgi:ATP-dependent RNA helicase DDX47/RRP3
LEAALGKRINEHKMMKDEVMIFMERVSEAQRAAALEMKELNEKRGQKGSLLRHRRHGKQKMDKDEG